MAMRLEVIADLNGLSTEEPAEGGTAENNADLEILLKEIKIIKGMIAVINRV